MTRCHRCGKPIEDGYWQCPECSERSIRQSEIKESIEFNAREIAQIIDQAEWIIKNAGSEYEKRVAKMSAYEDITELIYARGE